MKYQGPHHKTELFVALGVLLIVSAALAQDVRLKPAPDGNSAIKIDVDLILVNATVTDSRSEYVGGLERKHFQLWEDKVEQQIEHFYTEEVPLSVGIIFDISESMKDKLAIAYNAVSAFLKMGRAGDEYFLVQFSSRARLLQNLTTDISKIQDRLLVAPANGATALYDAVYSGLEKINEGSHRRKALLLITDGEDNRSRYNLSDVTQFVKEQDVQIYAIGIVDGEGQPATGYKVIEELSERTGGKAFFPASASELEDAARKIRRDLSNQYVLGYRSSNKAQDGKWRALRLRVNPPPGLTKLTVRTKAGYYARSIR